MQMHHVMRKLGAGLVLLVGLCAGATHAAGQVVSIQGIAGRYYDPLRMDMTSFAGSLTGATREEQIFANDEWVT